VNDHEVDTATLIQINFAAVRGETGGPVLVLSW
jgi:hypothetical protein